MGNFYKNSIKNKRKIIILLSIIIAISLIFTLIFIKSVNENEISQVQTEKHEADEEVATEVPKVENVTPWDEKKDNDIIMIQCIEDLVRLSKDVNEGVSNYEGKTFKLETDLDFQSPNSYVDSTTTEFGDVNGNEVEEPLLTELTTEKGFAPIGNYDFPFSGSFDGQGHKIINLMVNNSNVYAGFIGLIKGTDNVKLCNIANIQLENVNITTESYYSSAIVGRCEEVSLSFENCKVSGNLHTRGESGAMLGLFTKGYQSTGEYDLSFKNCINNANFSLGGWSYRAGMVGKAENGKNLSIEKCENNGKISGSTIGGILGYSNFDNVVIKNSKNTADLEIASDAGGIYSCREGTDGKTIVENCINYGNISVYGDYRGYLGGIAGKFVDPSQEIINCVNYGNITGTGSYIGGITGRMYTGSKIIGCINKGNITGRSGLGGIAGQSSGNSEEIPCIIERCYNTGKIESTYGSYVGGILSNGFWEKCDYINMCYNTGEIISPSYSTGGIAGENGYSPIKNCYNTGKVQGGYETGGIVGRTYSFGEIINSYNLGEIICEGNNNCVGGITGSANSPQIRNSYNLGKILAPNTKYAGSICSYAWINDKCYFLKGTSKYGIYAKQYTTDVGYPDTAKQIDTEEEMKELMNKNLTYLEEWIVDENNTNNGYPILNMQN